MGNLISGIIRDPSLIHEVLDSFCQYDKFMTRLLQVSDNFNNCPAGTPRQDIQMVIARTDYMIDVPSDQMKLVEYNTIASGAGPLSWKVGELQEYLSAKHIAN